MSYNPYTLTGKTVLITGASSGIGQCTAIECSKMGAKVVITGRNSERLQHTYDQLEGEGHIQIVADLIIDDELQRLVNECPPLDGIVNNAGIQSFKLTQFIKKYELASILNTNTIVPIMLVKSLLKGKKIKQSASIVFTSSVAGNYKCSIGNAMYATSKGAISAFMRNAALELASKGIRCNAVCPGMIETPIITKDSNLTEEQWELNKKGYPLKRYGRTEEVAWGIIYLLSDASSFSTGSSLVIDGGKTI